LIRIFTTRYAGGLEDHSGKSSVFLRDLCGEIIQVNFVCHQVSALPVLVFGVGAEHKKTVRGGREFPRTVDRLNDPVIVFVG
jgi:hypothetical protein